MNGTRRITANIPENLLREATAATGKGITETLVVGLELVRRRKALEKSSRLKGKLNLVIDIDTSRERAGR